MRASIFALAIASLSFSALAHAGHHKGPAQPGLDAVAEQELRDAGVDKYVGQFSPISTADAGGGWQSHLFDPQYGPGGIPSGPVCIAGTMYSAFSKAQDSSKLLIFLQGGGACWQDFYNCNILAQAQDPTRPRPPGSPPPGIFGDVPGNPLEDWSIVYLPYCDGSVFSGDHDVIDPNFPFGPARFHRGLRNVSAGVDLAKALFPDAQEILIAGSSAGGVGATSFTPFLTRFVFGNEVKVSIFNDAGPVAINVGDQEAIKARAEDWQFGQFYPASCRTCNDQGQSTPLIGWRLDNDSTIRESFYSTDSDSTNRFFMDLLDNPARVYRNILVNRHGKLHREHPDRYKRFIRSGDDSHTALQSPLFYAYDANGIPLIEWTRDFLELDPGDSSAGSAWVDVVEDFEPAE